MKKLGYIWLILLSMTGTVLTYASATAITPFLLFSVLVIPVVTIYILFIRGTVALHGSGAILAYVVIASAIHVVSSSWISVAYSVFFICAYVCLTNCWRPIESLNLRKVLQWIVVLYAANVLFSMILTWTGVSDGFGGGLFGRITLHTGEGIRYFGFSSEPSYAAFVIATCFVAMTRLSGPHDRKNMLWWLAVVALLMISFRSVYGYLLLALCTAFYAHRLLPRGTLFWGVLFASGAVALVAISGYTISLGSRIGEIVGAVTHGEVSSLADLGLVDSSLFMRVAPIVTYFSGGHAGAGALAIGHGAATSTQFFTDEFFFHLNPDSIAEILRPGFLPSFLYDYGLLGGAVVLGSLWKRVNGGRFSVSGIVMLAMLPNANLNTQLFWFVVTVFVLTTLAEKRREPSVRPEHVTIRRRELQCA